MTEVFILLISGLDGSEATIDPDTPADFTSFGNPAWFVRILDDDTTPTVSITGGSAVTEGSKAEFTVSAGQEVASDLEVRLTVSDAGAGSDFIASGDEGAKTVTIQKGKRSATYEVQTQGDTSDEPDADITVAITNNAAYTTGTPSSATVRVNDDDGAGTPTPANSAPTVSTVIPDQTPTVGTAFSYQFPSSTFADGDNDSLTYTATKPDGSALPSWLTFTAGTRTFSGTPAAGDTGTVTVRVTASDGTANVHDDFDLTVRPAAPTGFSVGAADRQVTLSWTNPNNNNITKYQYQYKQGNGSYGGWTNFVGGSSSTTTAHTVTGLTNGVRYTFKLRAVAGSVNGAESVEGSATPAAAGAPTPTTPTTTPVVTISGGPAVDEGEAAVFTLKVSGGAGYSESRPLKVDVRAAVRWNDGKGYYAPCGRGATGKTTTCRVPQTEDTKKGDWHYCAWIHPGSGYDIGGKSGQALRFVDRQNRGVGTTRVLDYDGAAANCPSGATVLVRDNDAKPAAPPPPPPAAPAKPAGFSAAAGDRQAVLSWSDPNNGDIAKWQYRFKTTGGYGAWTDISGSGAGTTGHTVTGLVNGRAYTFQVRARTRVPGSSFSDGPASDEASATPKLPVVSFAIAASNVDEGDVTHEVTMNLSPAPSKTIWVIANRTGSTATSFFREPDFRYFSSVWGVSAGETSITVPIEIVEDARDEPDETILMTLAAGVNRGYTVDDARKVHTVTILDDDGAPSKRLTFSAAALEVSEGASGSYTVRLATQPTGPVTVAIASDNTDVTVSPGTLTFNASGSNLWNAPRTVTVSAAQDNDATDDTATLTHTATGGGYGSVTGGVAVTVDDDEAPAAPPTITVTGGSAVTEGGNAVFTVNASPAPTSSLTVNLTVADDAASDFVDAANEGAKTVTIPAGQGSATYSVATVNDSIDEADGSVGVTVATGNGYTVGGPSSATVAVSDDDAPTLTYEGAVNSGSVEITVPSSWTGRGRPQVTGGAGNLSGWSGLTLDMTSPGSPPATVTVTWTSRPAGSANLPLEWQPIAGSSWQSTDGGAIGGTTFTIVEPSATPPPATPTITVTGGSAVTEGVSAVFTVNASPAPAANLTVNLTVADDATSDFVAAANEGAQTVVIQAGQTSAAYNVATVNDSTDEADGSVGVTVATGTGYTVGNPSSATVAVSDDDPTPTPTLTYEGAVNSGSVTITVPSSWQGRGKPQVSGGASKLTGWSGLALDMTSPGNPPATVTVTWTSRPAGSTNLPLEWQPIASGSSWQSSDGDPIGKTTFTITEPGAQPTPAAPAKPAGFAAAAGNGQVTLSWTDPGNAQITKWQYRYKTTGSYGSWTDVSGSGATTTSGTVTGLTNGQSHTFQVRAVAGSAEGAASDEASATPVAPATPVVRITGGSGVTEGGTATFTLTAAPAPTATITVNVEVTQSGTFAGSGQTGTRTVSIGTGGTATLSVTTVDDSADELNGSVTATVGTGTGYVPHGTGAAATVTVADNDVPGTTVRIAEVNSPIAEGGSAAFTVTATPAPSSDLTVNVQVTASGIGTTSGQTGARTVTIDTSGTGILSVRTENDDDVRPDGYILAELRPGAGYRPGNSRAQVRVTDNDAAALPTLSVSDASQGENARNCHGGRLTCMHFTVTLSRALVAGERVNFAWKTRQKNPVSARGSQTRSGGGSPQPWDYYSKDSWGQFRPGDALTQTLSVLILDDSHNEGSETFEVVLENPYGATLARAVATGTITNDDPMPAAWLARFGRTVAEQALDGIASRMTANRTPGLQATLAGHALGAGRTQGAGLPPAETAGTAQTEDGSAGAAARAERDAALAMGQLARAIAADRDAEGMSNGGMIGGPMALGLAGDPHGRSLTAESRTMTAKEALLGSSFSLTGERDGMGGTLAVWGRAAQSSFDGKEGAFALDGETTSAMLGADYARDRWMVGLALMQSDGEGGYRDTEPGSRSASQSCPEGVDEAVCAGAARSGDGKVEASLTAAIPYAALQASERLRLWGALGYGTGEVTLKPEPGGMLKADIDWTMAAAGMRGDVIAPPQEGSGPALALTSDALWARTSSDKTHELAASESDVTRLRLGLEGSYKIALEEGGTVVPKLEVGARHDGGDAETGFGVELGGGIKWTDPGLGLMLDLSGRTLIAHEDGDLKDRGYAASVSWDPAPGTKRGPSLSMRQAFGGSAQGGLDALFASDPLADRTGSEATSRWQAEAAWGLPVFGGRWTGSPHAGLGLAADARDYSLGWRLTPEAKNAPDLSFGVKAARRENGAEEPEHRVGVELRTRW